VAVDSEITMLRFTWSVLLLTACGGGAGGGSEATPKDDGCDVSVQSLAGTTFVMSEAMPDKSYKDNPLARLKFEEKDGKLLAKYTVKSISDVYTYECLLDGDGEEAEVKCREEERLVDWCKALLVADWGSCTTKNLKELGSLAPDEEIKAAIRKAKAEAKKVKAEKNAGSWKRFELENNNLGNKLQGRLFAKKAKRECQLSIEDMYFTIHNGEGIEDFNPVGKNGFVKTEEPYVFEHCTDGYNLAPFGFAERPKKIEDYGDRRAPQAADKDIFYHYIGDKLVKAEKGCSYSFDTYSQLLPAEQSVEVKPSDKKGALEWTGKTSYPSDALVRVDAAKAGIFHMLRYKTCASGKRELVDVLCSASIIR
jgi:hypothetical protein